MSDDLSLEKLRIHERLSAVETESKETNHLLREIRNAVLGDGTPLNPGYNARLMAVESYQKEDKEDKKSDFTLMHKIAVYGGGILLALERLFHVKPPHGTP